MKLQEKEWFAEREPRDRQRRQRRRAQAPDRGAQATMIRRSTQQFLDDSRKAEGESHFLRNSGRYPALRPRRHQPLRGLRRGHARLMLNERAASGCVLPTGIATDDTTKFFFAGCGRARSRLSACSTSRTESDLFPSVDTAMSSSACSPTGRGVRATAEAAEFVFFAHAVEDLQRPRAAASRSRAEDIALLNPNTRTCPIFRSRSGRRAHQGHLPPRAGAVREAAMPERTVEVRLARMFDMSNDSDLFRTREQLETRDGIWTATSSTRGR